MLIAIAIESTHMFSSDNTSGWLRALYQSIAGAVTDTQWRHVHHIIRKTGHFTGYGLLGVVWLRSWLLFWRTPMRHRTASVLCRYAFALALSCTMLVATFDELHQSFMADRTGLVSDVLLDTSGAFALMALAVLLYVLRHKQYGQPF